LGKRTLIYNELPRIAWERDEFPIDQTEVRTSRFYEFQLFGGVMGRRQNFRCFQVLYEPDCRFEPTGAVTLQFPLLFFLLFLVVDDPGFRLKNAL
jgi:hypothetical protein